MTARQINTFRKLLEAKQADLTERIERMRDRLAISERGDVLDRVWNVNERELTVRDLAFDMRLLKSVQEALREIKAGTFGRCAACDHEIPLRRLQAVPWSPYCIRCQELAETRTALENGARLEHAALAG
jgi:RNA polymerase-binding transcription factor